MFLKERFAKKNQKKYLSLREREVLGRMSVEAKWSKMRIELTNKANIFEKNPISNTVQLST